MRFLVRALFLIVVMLALASPASACDPFTFQAVRFVPVQTYGVQSFRTFDVRTVGFTAPVRVAPVRTFGFAAPAAAVRQDVRFGLFGRVRSVRTTVFP